MSYKMGAFKAYLNYCIVSARYVDYLVPSLYIINNLFTMADSKSFLSSCEIL